MTTRGRIVAAAAVTLTNITLAAQAATAAPTDCAVSGGRATPTQLRACDEYGAHMYDLAIKAWPRMRGIAWGCAITGRRTLTCDLVVQKRLGGKVRMYHDLAWRTTTGTCTVRQSTDDFTGRWPFAPNGCLRVHRSDI